MKWLDKFIRTHQGCINLPTKVQGNEEDSFYDKKKTIVELSPATEERNEDEHFGDNLEV